MELDRTRSNGAGMTKGEGGGDALRAASAVERSLEDFIVRANSALPSSTAAAPTEIDHGARARLGIRRRAAKDTPNRTLVVLGSQRPLAEVTEIVARIPEAELVRARSRWPGVRVALAFIAGAGGVLLITKIFAGGPQPMPPAPPAPSAQPAAAPNVTRLPPPPVVQRIPVVESAPAPTLPAPVAAPPAALEPKAEAAAPLRRPRPTPKVIRSTVTDDKSARGLVDPFAN